MRWGEPLIEPENSKTRKNTIADEPSHKKAWKQRRKRERRKSGLTRSYSSLSNKQIDALIYFLFFSDLLELIVVNFQL